MRKFRGLAQEYLDRINWETNKYLFGILLWVFVCSACYAYVRYIGPSVPTENTDAVFSPYMPSQGPQGPIKVEPPVTDFTVGSDGLVLNSNDFAMTGDVFVDWNTGPTFITIGDILTIDLKKRTLVCNGDPDEAAKQFIRIVNQYLAVEDRLPTEPEH